MCIERLSNVAGQDEIIPLVVKFSILSNKSQTDLGRFCKQKQCCVDAVQMVLRSVKPSLKNSGIRTGKLLVPLACLPFRSKS